MQQDKVQEHRELISYNKGKKEEKDNIISFLEELNFRDLNGIFRGEVVDFKIFKDDLINRIKEL